MSSTSALTLAQARSANNLATFPGRRAVVVGGTAGLGRAVAIRLAKAQFDVTIAGRNAELGQQVVAEMNKAGNGKHDFKPLDASLISHVPKFCEQVIHADSQPVDVLVLTQGTAYFGGAQPTSEGIDRKLALHYFSRIAVLSGFLPSLKQSQSPRVLSILSAGIHSPYAEYKTDFTLQEHYSLKNCADAAGFYNDLALDYFARENPNLTLIHAAPGVVATSWGSEFPAPVRWLTRLFQKFATPAEDAAEFLSLRLLQPDDKRVKGLVLQGAGGQVVGKTKLHTDEAVETVWKQTVEVFKRCGVDA